MLKDDAMICDGCQKKITRVTSAPPEGWPHMHNLCSSCFVELGKRSIPRA